MSISTLRRQVKNVAYNFSDAQVKVREATSNDPWGPTTALMSEIADLTHNPMSFTEIMSMLWKRLNDHGKNWRHVYKSLVLLDYLIKCGSEKVAQQCRENIFSIETLRDFQHIEDNRDQGLNVREKAKQMVSLLNDEERLRNERARFLLTRKRFIQNGAGLSSDGIMRSNRLPTESGVIDSDFEEARPSSLGEEEMQLQIAIALSREECQKEEELRKGDAIRLQIALEESKRAISEREAAGLNGQQIVPSSALSQTALDDLLSLGLGEPTQTSSSSSMSTAGAPSTSKVAAASSSSSSGLLFDPWAPISEQQQQHAAVTASATPTFGNGAIYPSLSASTPLANNDPWGGAPAAVATPLTSANTPTILSLNPSTNGATPLAPSPQNDPWATFEAMTPASAGNNGTALATANGNRTPQPQGQQRSNVKTPESFLGENSSLVNLDNLMGPSSTQPKSASNPFVLGSSIPAATVNPFVAQQRPSPSLHEMMHAQRNVAQPSAPPAAATSPTNPFAAL